MFSGQDNSKNSKKIKNNGFWPDIDLADFFVDRSMSPNINDNLLISALVSAITDVNISLAKFEKTQKEAGKASANEIGVISVDDKSSTVIIYQKAVFARAKADLIGEFVSISNKKDTINQNQNDMYQALLAESSREVRKIIGLKRVTAELI